MTTRMGRSDRCGERIDCGQAKLVLQYFVGVSGGVLGLGRIGGRRRCGIAQGRGKKGKEIKEMSDTSEGEADVIQLPRGVFEAVVQGLAAAA